MILDPIADKGLLLSGIITLSISNWSSAIPHYGQFPVWFPVLVITRDVVILVGSAVLHLLNGTVIVRTSWTGKVATVLQMAAIAWVMLQLHFFPLTYVVAAAGLFTLISGMIYVLRRRAAVAGRRARERESRLIARARSAQPMNTPNAEDLPAKLRSSGGRTSANRPSSTGWPGATSRSCTISRASRAIDWPRPARAAHGHS